MSNPYILGLTGSIGMGKSTTARLFAEAGIAVWDADAVVGELYNGNAHILAQIAAMLPAAVVNQSVDRTVLKSAIAKDETVLHRLEMIVRPPIAENRKSFLAAAAQRGAALVVIDHPLLFESKTDACCDGVLVVTVSAQEQRRRLTMRGTMDDTTLKIILAKQMPDAQKQSRADFIIETNTITEARAEVQTIIEELKEVRNA